MKPELRREWLNDDAERDEDFEVILNAIRGDLPLVPVTYDGEPIYEASVVRFRPTLRYRLADACEDLGRWLCDAACSIARRVRGMP